MPHSATYFQTFFFAATTAVATALKFLALKLWVLAPGSLLPAAAPAAKACSSRRRAR